MSKIKNHHLFAIAFIGTGMLPHIAHIRWIGIPVALLMVSAMIWLYVRGFKWLQENKP